MRGMLRTCCAVIALVVGSVTTALAQGGYVSTDRFGYSGSIMRYTSLADAMAGTNAVSGSPFAVPQRDLSLYVVNGNTGFGGATYANMAMFMSAWWLNGGNTPSNSNYGFIQLYDTEGGSVATRSEAWLNDARTDFWMKVTGGSTVYGCTEPGDCGRLWNAGSPAGSAATTGGIFHSYSLEFVATGLAPATFNASTGVWESNSNPGAVTGNLRGIFENTNTTDLSSNGFYVYDLEINMTSLYGTNSDSYFGTNNVVPEPSTYLMMGFGLMMLTVVGRKRRGA